MTALMLVSTKALQQARVYLLASLLSCTASAQLDSAIQDAVTALELSDVILASGLTDFVRITLEIWLLKFSLKPPTGQEIACQRP